MKLTGPYLFAAFLALAAPGDWNTRDERLFRYRDIVWYQRDFDLQKVADKRYYLHFAGVNYKANVYEKQLDMLSRSDFVQGMSPWVRKDFRSAMRSHNSIQEGYNRKGLVSGTGERKQAFFVMRDFYAQSAGKKPR